MLPSWYCRRGTAAEVPPDSRDRVGEREQYESVAGSQGSQVLDTLLRMDFSATLAALKTFFETQAARYALIGGHALAALGKPRATLDLDLIVEATLQPALIGFLEEMGYRTLYRSAGYSNHLHAEPRFGRLDFVYVQASTADDLFDGCRAIAGPGGIEVPVPRPEHLIAMKLHAMNNDPRRRLQDLADIRSLMTLPQVDRSLVRSYFEKRNQLEEFDALEEAL